MAGRVGSVRGGRRDPVYNVARPNRGESTRQSDARIHCISNSTPYVSVMQRHLLNKIGRKFGHEGGELFNFVSDSR